MRTISIGTFKGGQSKTVTSVLLSRKLAELGKKVLAISICGQNDLNLYLGAEEGERQLFHALSDNDIKSSIVSTKIDSIDYVHNDLLITKSIDSLLQTMTGSENRLKILFKQIKNEYDYIICDTPPSLNISTIASIVASDYLICPTQMRWSSINGLMATMSVLKEVIDLEMSNCKYLGIIRSMTNIMRDEEAFTVEKWIDERDINKLGDLPSSAALRKALFDFSSYNDIKKHHHDQVNNLLNNIIKLVPND